MTRAILALMPLLPTTVAVSAQQPPAADPARPIAAATSWEHAGSDIPADPTWRTGTLPNGVRYAIRRNALPPGSVSVRVRIDVGALMETDEQQGWTHMMEHMAFRGTEHYPDGEGVRIWQRLGASFGIDTNAATSLTATTYALDLPRADVGSLHIAMPVLAEMMESARVDPAPLDTERKVVLAEGALRLPPLAKKIQTVARPLFYSGTKAATRDILGTDATLSAASADKLRAFYHHWYRPSRAVVVVVGDADPAALEAEVKASFGGWKASGAEPAEPDYGVPRQPSAPAATVSDPQAPNTAQLAWITPHDDTPFTVARQQRQLLDLAAAGIVDRRLATEAQKGRALVSAHAGIGTQRHVADQLTVAITPKPEQAKAALDEAYAVLNGAAATPPSAAEIDAQAASIRRALAQAVPERQTATSATLATGYVDDVDEGDVTPDPRFYVDLFEAERATLTPATVGKAIARLIAPEPRMLLLSSSPSTGPDQAPTLLASARRVAAAGAENVRAVSLDELRLPGRAGTVVAHSTIADLGITRVRFANGVTLDYKKTGFEKDRIRVRVVVGHGLLGRAPNDPGLFWSSGALLAAGVGPFTADELARLTAGRQIGSTIGGGSNGVVLASATTGADATDALRLITGELTQMRYAATPVARLKDQYTATYQTYYSQPQSVLQAFGAPYFYGGDIRFRAIPPLPEVQALSPATFQAFWQEQLASGPIRVEAVGDLDGAALERAVAATLGALPPRAMATPSPALTHVVASAPLGGLAMLRHSGAADQAAVARVYPTLGALADLPTSRALDLAATLIETRLTEEFREQEGGTYSPFAAHAQATYLPDYGALLVGAQISVTRIGDFNRALDRIVADLAANGPNADALARARATRVSAAERDRSDNGYWAGVLESPLDDPRTLEAVRTRVSGRAAVDAAAVKAVVARYLARPGAGFTVEALPKENGH